MIILRYLVCIVSIKLIFYRIKFILGECEMVWFYVGYFLKVSGVWCCFIGFYRVVFYQQSKEKYYFGKDVLRVSNICRQGCSFFRQIGLGYVVVSIFLLRVKVGGICVSSVFSSICRFFVDFGICFFVCLNFICWWFSFYFLLECF